MATQLPALPEVERLSSSVIRILGGNPSKFTLQGTNTYLLGRTGSRNRILIDTAQGFPSWSKVLSSVLEQENATISTCLITHWHHDHVGGINDLKSLCPEVKIWKHTPSLWGEETPDKLPEGINDGEVHAIEDGTVFDLDADLKVTALHCPGHTADHSAFLIAESKDESEKGAIFTGDNVLGHGTSVFSSLSRYMASLAVMADRLPSDRLVRAYPAHGAVIEDGKSKIQEYIRHRQQREDEILAALGSGSGATKSTGPGAINPNLTAMQIVKIVYKDVPETLHEAAQRGVLQVLAKLEEDGKVVRKDDAKWTLQTAPDANKSTL